MTYETVYLTLLYVLSAAATFVFLYERSKRYGRKFAVVYSLLAALFWPVFFVYQVRREFSK